MCGECEATNEEVRSSSEDRNPTTSVHSRRHAATRGKACWGVRAILEEDPSDADNATNRTKVGRYAVRSELVGSECNVGLVGPLSVQYGVVQDCGMGCALNQREGERSSWLQSEHSLLRSMQHNFKRTEYLQVSRYTFGYEEAQTHLCMIL